MEGINLQNEESTKYIAVIQKVCTKCTETSCEKCPVRITFAGIINKALDTSTEYLSYALIEDVIKNDVPAECLSKSERRKQLEDKEYEYTLNQVIVCAQCEEMGYRNCRNCPVAANWRKLEEAVYKEKLILTP